ncbi:MAG: amidase domain-containing protein [Firmicutes bacterium]|nr:amidase domain-containing protein [Bacillota bacterium]
MDIEHGCIHSPQIARLLPTKETISRFVNMDASGGGGDCANVLSQCLFAGGWPTDYRESSVKGEWWYRRIGPRLP